MKQKTLMFQSKTTILQPEKCFDTSNKQNTSILKMCLYKKYTEKELKECVVGWVMEPETKNMFKFCQNGNVPRTTLLTYLKHIPQLLEMKKMDKKSVQEVEQVYDMFIQRKLVQRRKHLQKVHQANLYLSPDEEGTMVYFAVLMSQCGRGICKDEFLDSVNLILREKRSKSNFTPATMGTVEGILKRNDILKNTVCSTSALDPARAAQALVETRDSMFTKLENYIVLLHELGIFKEKSFLIK